jgi:hypothetical protein
MYDATEAAGLTDKKGSKRDKDKDGKRGAVSASTGSGDGLPAPDSPRALAEAEVPAIDHIALLRQATATGPLAAIVKPCVIVTLISGRRKKKKKKTEYMDKDSQLSHIIPQFHPLSASARRPSGHTACRLARCLVRLKW